MAVVKVYDQDKTEQGELTLTPEVFEVAVRPEILHLVVRAQLAAKRAGTRSTKTRAMVSGDIPFSMFYMTFLAILTLAGNLISDILYAVVDPRVRIA